MKVFKKIMFIVLLSLFICLIYITISYIKIGINMPHVLAGKKITFMGGYILAIIFGVLSVICGIIIMICIIKWRKTNEKRIHKRYKNVDTKSRQ